MRVPISVERQPGLMSTLGYTESLLHVRRFIDSTPALAGTELLDDLRRYTNEDGESDELLGYSFKGLARQLRDFFTRRRLVVVGEETGEIPITAHELHLPAAPGCSARLTTLAAGEETTGFSVDVFGIGGGDEFSLAFEAGYTIEAATRCVRVAYSVPAVWEVVEVSSGDGQGQRYLRLKDINPSCERLAASVPDADPCHSPGLDPSNAVERREFDLPDEASIGLTTTLKIQANREWSSKVGIRLSALDVGVDVAMRAKQSFTTELEYALVSGHRYVAWRRSDNPAWLWRSIPTGSFM